MLNLRTLKMLSYKVAIDSLRNSTIESKQASERFLASQVSSQSRDEGKTIPTYEQHQTQIASQTLLSPDS